MYQNMLYQSNRGGDYIDPVVLAVMLVLLDDVLEIQGLAERWRRLSITVEIMKKLV
jgi:hypothetical protein